LNTNRRAPACETENDIIVVGWIHWIGWLHPSTKKMGPIIKGSPIYVPTVFGPGRTAWNVCDCGGTDQEPLTLSCAKPNGHVDSWILSVHRLKQLGIPASGRYANTSQEYYTGDVVGFDHEHPLVAFGDRLLTLKDEIWSKYDLEGNDTHTRFIEVRDDSSVLLKEFEGHVFEIARTRAGMTRFDLGRGRLTKAIGAGSNALLVSVEDDSGDVARLRFWNIVGALPKFIGLWKATEVVFASNGQIYRETNGGIDASSRRQQSFGWTQLQPIEDSGAANIVRVDGEVHVTDIDPATHRLWGTRLVRGHMGEPFVEDDYSLHTQRVLSEATINSVGRYERLAFVESLYLLAATHGVSAGTTLVVIEFAGVQVRADHHSPTFRRC
jgi:hypothetical protein